MSMGSKRVMKYNAVILKREYDTGFRKGQQIRQTILRALVYDAFTIGTSHILHSKSKSESCWDSTAVKPEMMKTSEWFS